MSATMTTTTPEHSISQKGITSHAEMHKHVNPYNLGEDQKHSQFHAEMMNQGYKHAASGVGLQGQRHTIHHNYYEHPSGEGWHTVHTASNKGHHTAELRAFKYNAKTHPISAHVEKGTALSQTPLKSNRGRRFDIDQDVWLDREGVALSQPLPHGHGGGYPKHEVPTITQTAMGIHHSHMGVSDLPGRHIEEDHPTTHARLIGGGYHRRASGKDASGAHHNYYEHFKLGIGVHTRHTGTKGHEEYYNSKKHPISKHTTSTDAGGTALSQDGGHPYAHLVGKDVPHPNNHLLSYKMHKNGHIAVHQKADTTAPVGSFASKAMSYHLKPHDVGHKEALGHVLAHHEPQAWKTKEVPHGGKTYYATGKMGTHNKTGLPSREFRHNAPGDSDHRVWVNHAGHVSPE